MRWKVKRAGKALLVRQTLASASRRPFSACIMPVRGYTCCPP